MNEKITAATKSLQEKMGQEKAILDQFGEAELTTEAMKSLELLNKDMGDLETELKELRESEAAQKSYRDGAASRQQRFSQEVHDLGQASRGGAVKSAGEIFANAEAIKSWLKTKMPNGTLPAGMNVGESPAIDFNQSIKALITGASATSAGALVQRDYYPLIELPFRPLTIRNIVTELRTTSDLIEYPSITGYTNAAAPVAEATTTSNGTKPESSLALKKETTSVKTIAHWIPVTRRALSDAAQIQSYIDAFLADGLQQVLEDQMVNGDGTGENFLGLANTSGLTPQAFDTDIKTTIRKARTKSQVVARAMPDWCLMNPYDWETQDLDQDNELRYYYGGPSQMGNPRLWGLPVITSESVAQGTAYVGPSKELLLWDREQTTIRMSDSHASFFIQNLIAVLAELRAAFAVRRPAAIVVCDLTA